MRTVISAVLLSTCFALQPARAGMITVSFTADGGGSNRNQLNGLSAQATFTSSSNFMSVLLKNTSSGMPSGFDTSSSLLVSLGFNLPAGISILSGDAAVIGDGSRGLGSWSLRGAGASVVEDWAWTNQGGGDLLHSFKQVITTSHGNQGLELFGGGSPNIAGPYGGIAANPVLASIPGSKRAVSDSILFSLTLSGPIRDDQLRDVAGRGIVEFGSDVRYLQSPEPGTVGLLAVGALVTLYRRARFLRRA